MNKAFVREPDQATAVCPRCGSVGETVRGETLRAWLSEAQRRGLAEPASFCPSPQCKVVYFDGFEQTILTSDLPRAVYPKDPSAPICACFGLTTDDIEQDVREGGTTRVKLLLQRAASPAACCVQQAANGRCCVPLVRKYYLQCRDGKRAP
jgi:hypothetical protein